MHKQDFVHVRALIEECYEKANIIRELQSIISANQQTHIEEIDYERAANRQVNINLSILQSDCDSYVRALSKCRDDIRQHVATIQDLRKENLALRAGPTPSDEDVIDLLRAQLSDFYKTTSPKITAIKTARELQRCGLKEAKDLVESMPEFAEPSAEKYLLKLPSE